MPGSFTVSLSLHRSQWQVSYCLSLNASSSVFHYIHVHRRTTTHAFIYLRRLSCVTPRVSPALQPVYVFGWEPCLQGQTLHYSLPTHGLVVGAQCACRHLPDAGHHALPRRLLHLPDKVGQRWKRVLHESEYFRDTTTSIMKARKHGAVIQESFLMRERKKRVVSMTQKLKTLFEC